MNPNLPESISAYFSASNGQDTSHIEHYFSADAVVIDEGSPRRGLAAIGSWMQEAQTRFQFRAEPKAVARDDERVVVTATVTGNFPGSPASLHYAFLLKDNKIQFLEIN
jgi:ketosteroid isomerase-like protein